MSKSGEAGMPGKDSDALAALEALVDRLLDRCEELREQALASEARYREMIGVLGRDADDAGGADGAERVARQLRDCEAERAVLRGRMAEARERTERMMARIRFLEEHDG